MNETAGFDPMTISPTTYEPKKIRHDGIWIEMKMRWKMK